MPYWSKASRSGGIVAILLAPSSGEELRGKIQGEIQRVQDEMQLAAQTRRAELEDQLAQLRAPRKAGNDSELIL